VKAQTSETSTFDLLDARLLIVQASTAFRPVARDEVRARCLASFADNDSVLPNHFGHLQAFRSAAITLDDLTSI